MDSSSEGVARFLSVLAACSEQLIDLARHLRSRNGVKSAQHSLAIRAYESGPMIEMFVDAELFNGKAVVWGIEIGWDRHIWKVDHFVRVNDAHGQSPVREFPEFSTATLEDVVRHLRVAAEELSTLAKDAEVASY